MNLDLETRKRIVQALTEQLEAAIEDVLASDYLKNSYTRRVISKKEIARSTFEFHLERPSEYFLICAVTFEYETFKDGSSSFFVSIVEDKFDGMLDVVRDYIDDIFMDYGLNLLPILGKATSLKETFCLEDHFTEEQENEFIKQIIVKHKIPLSKNDADSADLLASLI